MGSWNATCGVTQLPITAGDRVVLIPLIVKQPDFLARDNLGGTGSSSNDCIAQPVSLPIAGEYDDYGGIEAYEGQLGLQYLLQLFEDWVCDDQALVRIKSGKPHPVKKAEPELLEELMRGELHLMVPNTRKRWLQNLHDTYANMSDDEKPGFAHYLPQMEVDPATLPDRLAFPLAGMFVPEALYQALADAEGESDPYGYFNDATKSMVTLGANRREELELQASLKPAQRDKLAEAKKSFEEAVAAGDLDDDMVSSLLKLLPLQAMPNPQRLNEEYFFYSDAGDAAVLASGVEDNAAARKLWVDFMLFATAFHAMRKQWTPQAGAGSQCGLYETSHLYRATQAYLAQALQRYEDEVAAENA